MTTEDLPALAIHIERAQHQPNVAMLPDAAVIQIIGEDARQFLHAQWVSDVRSLDAEHGQLTAWCTAQGRVSFLLHLIFSDNAFYAILPASEAARLVQRLRMFVLRSRVTITDVSAHYGVCGLQIPAGSSPSAWATLSQARLAKSRVAESVHALCVEAGRYLILGERAALAAWVAAIDVAIVPAALWRVANIVRGYPEIEGIAVEAYLPQQLNLDVLNAVSFTKGCYPGQEIIARLKYRGEVKARLLCGHSAVPLAAGTKLYRATGAAQSAGQILTSLQIAENDTVVLAVAELAGVDSPLLAGSADGTPVILSWPPYWRAESG